MLSSRIVPSLVVAVTLGAALAALAPSATASTNLLTNSGFEETLEGHPWMPAGWDTSKAGLQTVFFGREEVEVHSGQRAATVASASALFNFAHNWSRALLVDRELWGKDLVFSVWTKSLGIEGRGYILLQAYRDTVAKMALTWGIEREKAADKLRIVSIADPSIDLGWARQYFTEPETDWVQRQARVFVPPGTDVVFVRCGVIGIGQVTLDDASLTAETALDPPVPQVNQEMLEDPGFEGDNLAWELSVPPFRGLVVEKQTAVKRSGQAAIRMQGEEMAWIKSSRVGVTQVICNRNLAGQRLRLEGYAKTDTLYGQVALKIIFHTPRGPFSHTAGGILGGTKDWTLKEIEADVPADAYAIWVYMGYSAPTRGVVFLDDLTLKIIGPARGG